MTCWCCGNGGSKNFVFARESIDYSTFAFPTFLFVFFFPLREVSFRLRLFVHQQERVALVLVYVLSPLFLPFPFLFLALKAEQLHITCTPFLFRLLDGRIGRGGDVVSMRINA
ncbi:uncharacterized protein TEOVI_000225900 [Trypanosoma equiperdum]|uniref:Uncharacterized protein n=3 Tax=Trypanozoon TaxID=39700 RepID=Q4GYL9_TRYB2|nr:hypothetical protein, unlikely [Trypanosoma brucei brucei TREU927]XP_011771500.1 hypothetical protein, unlikely [Trypanosoma brucei gambiense DAL972]CAJ16565.1 hypothetical protein, unlikely [Trypanosoma brucei brucei TREU927]CBH09059.1 hypothetical protein, unlikely [Trypanosoma brucei gambiense DAL972]SCU70685.1 hypothetical protein, conserved [Trypanosoma equiperdum]|eukprot:XP_011771500.1 hypothetical protein, unlikely [Trypanosoma brucei gambiense DAL972]